MGVPKKDKMSPERNALVQKIQSQVVNKLKGSNGVQASSSSNGRGGNKSLTKVKCYKCNKMGQYANKCPFKTSDKGGTTTTPTPEKWKHQPPRSGDPRTKTVNGKEYHW
jgi:hypothetical protein